jgi:hypothetical protein
MVDEVVLTAMPSTPVYYRFVSVHRIVGFSALADGRDLPLNLSLPDTNAYLTADPNPTLTWVDQGAAVAELIARAAFTGEPNGGANVEALRSRAVQLAQERTQRLGSPRVYFVLEIIGNLQTASTEVARDLGGAIVAFDAVDKVALIAGHQRVVNAALSALSLIVETSSEIVKVSDGVSLELPDGRPLYSLSVTANSPRLTVSRPVTKADATRIEEAIGKFIADERLTTPSRLLVDALRRAEDRLESFIFAWAALEMVIRKVTANCETGDWVKTISGTNQAAAEKLHQAFVDAKHQSYSLVARVRVFGLMYDMTGIDDLANEVSRIRKNIREPLFHEGKLDEQGLPVEAVTALVRKLLTCRLWSA